MILATSSLIFTSLAIAFPWLNFVRNAYTRQPNNPHRLLHASINTVLLLNTLLLLRKLILASPLNLFKELDVGINTPTDAIRALLLGKAQDGELPRHLEVLLKKMGTKELRAMYVRFGHDAFVNCDYCTRFEDYALYTFAPVFVSYVGEAALVSFITIKNSFREPLRTPALGILVLAGVSEAYNLLTAHVGLDSNNNVFWWHDTLTLLRHLLFLLLPLLLASPLALLLPAPLNPFPRAPAPTPADPTRTRPNPASPPNPGLLLHATLQTLQTALTRLHALKYTQAAVMRAPGLRTAAATWWEREAREGAAVRADEEVRRVARGVGLGYESKGEMREVVEGLARELGVSVEEVERRAREEAAREGLLGAGGMSGVRSPQGQVVGKLLEEGPLRTSARMAVQSLQSGYVPSQYWTN